MTFCVYLKNQEKMDALQYLQSANQARAMLTSRQNDAIRHRSPYSLTSQKSSASRTNLNSSTLYIPKVTATSGPRSTPRSEHSKENIRSKNIRKVIGPDGKVRLEVGDVSSNKVTGSHETLPLTPRILTLRSPYNVLVRNTDHVRATVTELPNPKSQKVSRKHGRSVDLPPSLKVDEVPPLSSSRSDRASQPASSQSARSQRSTVSSNEKKQIKKARRKKLRVRPTLSDPTRMWNLRMKFIEQCRSYFGVPYAKRYWTPEDEHYHARLFLDCCGLVRRVMRDLKREFGFRIGPWNQAYMYDTLPGCVSREEDMKPGDLVFIKATYFNPKMKKQPHDITHVEVWLGDGVKTIGARWQKSVVKIFDSYKFEAKAYHSETYIFKSIDPWLMGRCKSYCKIHPWKSRAEKFKPSKRSIFNLQENDNQTNKQQGNETDSSDDISPRPHTHKNTTHQQTSTPPVPKTPKQSARKSRENKKAKKSAKKVMSQKTPRTDGRLQRRRSSQPQQHQQQTESKEHQHPTPQIHTQNVPQTLVNKPRQSLPVEAAKQSNLNVPKISTICRVESDEEEEEEEEEEDTESIGNGETVIDDRSDIGSGESEDEEEDEEAECEVEEYRVEDQENNNNNIPGVSAKPTLPDIFSSGTGQDGGGDKRASGVPSQPARNTRYPVAQTPRSGRPQSGHSLTDDDDISVLNLQHELPPFSSSLFPPARSAKQRTFCEYKASTSFAPPIADALASLALRPDYGFQEQLQFNSAFRPHTTSSRAFPRSHPRQFMLVGTSATQFTRDSRSPRLDLTVKVSPRYNIKPKTAFQTSVSPRRQPFAEPQMYQIAAAGTRPQDGGEEEAGHHNDQDNGAASGARR